MGNMKKTLQVALLLMACTVVSVIGVKNVKAVSYDINVTDAEYGADGTDKLSDYASIQKALNSVRDSESMVTVYVPAGTYYLDRGLTMYSNTHLILDEKAVMIRTDETAFMLQSYRDNETGGYGQFHDIIIEGGTWDGNIKADTSAGQGTPMMFYHGKNITIKNADIKNYSSRHLVIIAGVDGITVDNVSFSGAHQYTGKDAEGSYFIYEDDGTLNKEANFRAMEALHLDCINEDGETEIPGLPYDNTNNKNISVTNCSFENVFTGVGTHCEYNPVKAENMNITGNTFKNLKYTCVDVFDTVNAIVEDNTATSVGEFVRSNNSSDVVISNNKATMIINKTYNMYAAYLIDTTATITDCDFVNASSNGLYLNNSKLDKLENFSISKAIENGIAVVNNSEILSTKNVNIKDSGICGVYGKNAGTISISDFTISGSKDCGIATENCKSVSVENNTILNSTSHAVSIIGTSSAKYNAAISGNTITGSNIGISTHGITFTAIDNNSISDAKGIGIAIHSDVKADSVSNNTVSKTGDIGIFISTKSNITKLNDNVIVSTVKDGIYIKDNSSVGIATGNELNEIGQYGLFVNASTAKLDNNIVKTTQRHGINISNGSDVEISGNQITNAGQYGIYVSDSKGVITGNLVDTTTRTGIGVSTATSSSKDKLDIKENTVISAGDQGIYVYKSDYINVGDNNVSESTTQGIKITGSNHIVISDNETVDNQKQGIMADSSNNCILDGNVVLGSGDYGIYITTCKDIDVNENVSANNAKVDIVANNNTTGSITNNAVGEGGIVNWNGSPVNISGTAYYIGLCTFDKIAKQSYTGKEIKPAVKVTDNGVVLKAGIDYTVTYINNTGWGIGIAKITGKGKYGGSYEIPFEIAIQRDGVEYSLVEGALIRVYNLKTAATLPNDVITEIATSAFNGNTKLKYLYIPSSVKKIDESAFAGCSSLKYIYYQGTKEDWENIDILAGNDALDISKVKFEYYDKFTDVLITDWFTPYVHRAYNNKLITGLNATSFAPNDPLSRAMAVTILYRLDGKPAVEMGESGFTDVTKQSDWYYKPVLWAKTSKVVTGYVSGPKAGSFGTDDFITRQDFAVIMYRYVRYCLGDEAVAITDTTSYMNASDYREVSGYAVKSIQWAYNNGIMGVGSNLNPTGQITRGETATIILRVMDYIQKYNA